MKRKNPDVQIAKEFEKMWWSEYFEQCKRCIHTCKQSHMILELNCKKFEERTNDNDKERTRTSSKSPV
jgi:hypothetical protein